MGRYTLTTLLWTGLMLATDAFAAGPGDLTDVPVGRWGTGAYNDVFLSGTTAYVAADHGMDIVDLTFMAAPSRLGQYYTTVKCNEVYVSGYYAYLAGGDIGLQIVDVSDPTDPLFVSEYDTPGFAEGVFYRSGYVYVADGSCGLEIINVANPAAPFLAANYPLLGYARRVHPFGNYACIAAGTWGLEILDISNPAAPSFKGHCFIGGQAMDVDVQNVGYFVWAYVADGDQGLQLISCADPANPEWKNGVATYGTARDIQVQDGYAYLADSHHTESKLLIFDVHDWAHLWAVQYSINNNILGVAVSGDFAAIAESVDGLETVNISTFGMPCHVGWFDDAETVDLVRAAGDLARPDHRGSLTLTDIHDLQAVGSLVYLAWCRTPPIPHTWA
jgi:hypothetical protein